MSETNGGVIGSGAEGEQPRHTAAQPEDHFLEAMAGEADEYRYGQLQQQYEAEYAIERMQLFVDFAGSETEQDREYIGSQRQLIAESIGRQAVAKGFADGLREQLYHAPSDGKDYHGRHRLEDRLTPDNPETEGGGEDPPEQPAPPSSQPEPLLDVEPVPDVPELSPLGSQFQAPNRGRLTHTIDFDDDEPDVPPDPPFDDLPPYAPPDVVPPPQREKVGVLNRLRHAYYAGLAVVATCIALPEKILRHRAVRAVVVAGGVAAVGLAVWLGPDLGAQQQQTPPVAEAVAPPPNTEQFFDTIHPDNYHGEPYEWTAAANHTSPAQATPQLQRIINHARDNGLQVDTWGSPAHGDWGIDSVTVKLPDGTPKSYYDTPRKLGILQLYANGAGQG